MNRNIKRAAKALAKELVVGLKKEAKAMSRGDEPMEPMTAREVYEMLLDDDGFSDVFDVVYSEVEKLLPRGKR